MKLPKRLTTTAVSLTWAASITACGRADSASNTLSTTVDSAGVSIVTGPAADVALPWNFTELYRVGGADSGAQSFTQVNVSNVATNGKDRFAVLDQDNNNTIHVFDSTGAWVRTVGAKGSGPGEMEYPQSVRMDTTGGLLVFDIMKRALLKWDGTGALLDEHRLVGTGSVSTVMPASNGELYVSLFMTDTAARIARLERWSAADTMVVDSLVGPRPKMVQLSCVGLALPPLFTGDLAWTVAPASVGPTSVATTTQSTYVIAVHQNGKIVRSIRRDITPVAAVPEDAAKLYPEGLKVVFQGGGCVTPSKEIGERIGVAPTLPVVRRMIFDPAGRMWVERYTFSEEIPMVDVFDPEGQYLGTVNNHSSPLGFLGPDKVLFPIEDAATGIKVVGVFRIGRQ